jgi:transcriptional regulator with XRE-family HTH domain
MTQPDPIAELQTAIQKHGTQTKFAEASGFPQSYISAVLRGERRPSDKLLNAIGLDRIVIKSGDAK